MSELSEAPRAADFASRYRYFPSAFDKDIDFLDDHGRAFIARSPFLVLATVGEGGAVDASPKGGPSGFVQVLDDHHLAWATGQQPARLLPQPHGARRRRAAVHDPRPRRDVAGERAHGGRRRAPGARRVRHRGQEGEGRRPRADGAGVRPLRQGVPAQRPVRHDEWPSLEGLPSAACMWIDHIGMGHVPEQEVVDSLEANYRETLRGPGGDLA